MRQIQNLKIDEKMANPSAACAHFGLLVVLELHLLQVLRLPRDVDVIGPGLNAGSHNLLAKKPKLIEYVNQDL